MAKRPVSYLGGAVLLGTAIGAVVGLLATPLSGKDLRGMLRKRASDAGRDIPERLKEVPGRFKDVPARLRRDLPSKLKDVNGALRDAPRRGRELLADLPDGGRRVLSRLPGWSRRRQDPNRPIDTTATDVTGSHDPSDDEGA